MRNDPHTHPQQTLPSMCLMCTHYSPATEGGLGVPSCPAFPNGIPDKIFTGTPPEFIPEPHLEPTLEQTNDITFEKADDVTDEMVAEWDDAWVMVKSSAERGNAGILPGEEFDEETHLG